MGTGRDIRLQLLNETTGSEGHQDSNKTNNFPSSFKEKRNKIKCREDVRASRGNSVRAEKKNKSKTK